MTTAESDSSPFWRFSLAFYRGPGVAEACIRLQDEAGVDVNLLLFLLWQAAAGRTLSREEVAGLEQRVAPWREQVVVPLRTIRRQIKAPPPLIEPGAAEAYRVKVKGLELEAERLQQKALSELAGAAALGAAAASPASAARANIAAYEAISPRPFPNDAVAVIMAAFSSAGVRIGVDQGGGS